jgi:hypothetical protein
MEIIINAKVGKIISLGKYDWRILAVENGKALLLSEKILSKHAYNRFEDTTWAECHMRSFLNNVFYHFLGEDKKRVVRTKLETKDNPWYGTSGGNDSKDYIFLLSIEEVVKYFGDSGRLAEGPTEPLSSVDDQYNEARIARDEDGNAWWWWLRSPGHVSNYAAEVTAIGTISVNGLDVDYGGKVDYMGRDLSGNSGGVRPALWLNLE